MLSYYRMQCLSWVQTNSRFFLERLRDVAKANVMTRFGERLREVRLKVGVSQEKLADLAKLHRTYVSAVERGRCNISLVNIEKLAIAMAVTMHDLMPEMAAAKKVSRSSRSTE
jgi:ribosome-binding protein aMBF1 (putative translation factor)